MKITLLFIVLLAGMSLRAQELTGKWFGYPNLKNMRLRMEFDIREQNGTYTVSLKIPDQSQQVYQADKVTWADKILSAEIRDARTAVSVSPLPDHTLKGTLRWEGFDFELLLTRVPVVFKRPQTPKAPFPYRVEEVTFRNENEGFALAGTLTLPAEKGKYKAVVLLSGSGQQDRNSTHSEHVPFWVIADYLTRQGIAVLRFDDRGTARSEGNFKEASLSEFDSDAQAAIAYLKTRTEILSDSIGIMGHSEGGFVALSIAGRKEAAFLITLASGGINGRELLLMQRAALLHNNGAKEEFIQKYNGYMRQAQDIALQTGDLATCERKLAELFAGSPLDGQAHATAVQLYTPSTLGLLRYDPEWDYPEINCPVLALNGEKDRQVPVENLEYIKKGITANGNTHVTIISYPNLNHMFQTATTGLPVEYSDIEETISPQVLRDIADWINRL